MIRKTIFVILQTTYLPAQGSPEDYDAYLDDLSGVVGACKLGYCSIVCSNANTDIGTQGEPRDRKSLNEQGKGLFNVIKT